MKEQKDVFLSGNELAAEAIKQINYHLMGYYPITPSTQVAERIDEMKANGEFEICMIPAEGEHSAAGICYGASTAGGRVINATSSQGLLYALEQLPVQAGTRFPSVLNVACRSVSGPLSIKGDHSDIMYALNTGWIILFANNPQQVYDLNICAIKISEKSMIPVIVAYDGFFTSHQKKNAKVFANDEDVRKFVGKYQPRYSSIDVTSPVSIGTYMNEDDYINNKYQLRLAMESAQLIIEEVFADYQKLANRTYHAIQKCNLEKSKIVFLTLGSTFDTLKEAINYLNNEELGAISITTLRPFPVELLRKILYNKEKIIVLERQDTFGSLCGNLGLEIKAVMQGNSNVKIFSRTYGLSGKEFGVEDIIEIYEESKQVDFKEFGYYGVTKGNLKFNPPKYFEPLGEEKTCLNLTKITENNEIIGGKINETTKMPKRLSPGHSACGGCGIFVNLNLLLRGIEGNVVLLFQTGCAMIVTSSYPSTSFKVPYVHNLFQNGAATLSGIKNMFYERQRRNEIPDGEITFIMVTGDGGLDIGLGSALASVIRDEGIIIFEYDNGGYMNTGYQLSYSTPQGAKSSTSHLGIKQYGKTFKQKNTPEIFKAAGCQYIATASEAFPQDFIQKAHKAQHYALNGHSAYLKSLSDCPLNWQHQPNLGRKIIEKAVNCCYFPLYEIEQGLTKLTYNPETKNKKIELKEYLQTMGITKHLIKPEYQDVYLELVKEIEHNWELLKIKSDHPAL